MAAGESRDAAARPAGALNRHAFAFWGVWPAAVMVLAQWEAARLLQTAYPLEVALVTVAGTLGIYGLDRLVERRRQMVTGARHHAGTTVVVAVAVAIVVLLMVAFPRLSNRQWLWLCCLGALGCGYLAVTAAYVKLFPGAKELIGGLCFTALIWGSFPTLEVLPVAATFLTGLANFLISSHQDQARDRHNGIRSLALAAPRCNLIVSRLCALAAFALFLFSADASPLPWVALAHGLWPHQSRHGIDWAFLPLLASPIRFLVG